MKQKVELTAEEKKKVRKQNAIGIVGLIIILVIICIPIFFLVDACSTHKAGDFTYEYDRYGSKERRVLITGLTEQGKQKEVLIIPDKINGYKVWGLMKRELIEWDNPTITLESENLTTLYFYRKIDLEVGIKCPNLKKVFVINAKEDISLEMQQQGSYELEEKGYIYQEVHFNRAGHYHMPPYPANVTYYYNYEGADNYGCYWLDNLDDGEKISYIPSEPTREGYKFDGWYCEPECLTPWNFETNTIKSNGEDSYLNQDDFIENKLYAKWV